MNGGLSSLATAILNIFINLHSPRASLAQGCLAERGWGPKLIFQSIFGSIHLAAII
jgi:hypothetical protein